MPSELVLSTRRGAGDREVTFESKDACLPAKFYFNSTTAHRNYPDKKITVTLLCKDQLTDVIAFLREQVQTQHAAEKEAG